MLLIISIGIVVLSGFLVMIRVVFWLIVLWMNRNLLVMVLGSVKKIDFVVIRVELVWIELVIEF